MRSGVRRINLWVAPEVWESATPKLRALAVAGARLPKELATAPFHKLTADQITAIATSASLLSWSAAALEAMAPVEHDDPVPRGRTPFPKLFSAEGL